jgi:hypothetical protein
VREADHENLLEAERAVGDVREEFLIFAGRVLFAERSLEEVGVR